MKRVHLSGRFILDFTAFSQCPIHGCLLNQRLGWTDGRSVGSFRAALKGRQEAGNLQHPSIKHAEVGWLNLFRIASQERKVRANGHGNLPQTASGSEFLRALFTNVHVKTYRERDRLHLFSTIDPGFRGVLPRRVSGREAQNETRRMLAAFLSGLLFTYSGP